MPDHANAADQQRRWEAEQRERYRAAHDRAWDEPLLRADTELGRQIARAQREVRLLTDLLAQANQCSFAIDTDRGTWVFMPRAAKAGEFGAFDFERGTWPKAEPPA